MAPLGDAHDGALAQKTSGELAASAAGKPADDEARRVRKIEMIDITSDIAVGLRTATADIG